MKILAVFRYKSRKLNILRLFVLMFVTISSYYYIYLSQPYTTIEQMLWKESEEIYITDKTPTQPGAGAANVSSAPLKEIVILRYTKYFGHEEPTPVLNGETDCAYLKKSPILTRTEHQAPFTLFNVPCTITFNREYLSDSNALVFHSHDLEREQLPSSSSRDLNKLWVYYQLESPQKTGLNLKAFSNTFNWTMTYRQDSDVYFPYAYVISNSNGKYSKSFTNKTGLVAWIVSNCDPPSKRQYFVYELQNYISKDIFGFCGNECPSKDCYSFVSTNYKFYLSFENSLCKDYITEKFFKALASDIVPVVYGGSHSNDYLSVAPEHSYIDARSFNSPADLAAYLLFLNSNENEYLKYFEWKKKYKILIPPNGYWCSLCQGVYEHLHETPPQIKWYRDLWTWWHNVGFPSENTGTNDIESKPKVKQFKTISSACQKPLANFTNFFHSPFKAGIGIVGKMTNWMRKNVWKQ